MKPILAIFAVLAVSGCASTLEVTYYSEPPGALLYQGDRSFGYTPVVLSYRPTDEQKREGVMTLRGTSVRWASGATATIPMFRVDLANGMNQQFTFQRPADAPGLAKDIRIGIEIEKLKLMRREASAQEAQAAALLFGGVAQQHQPSTTNCVSTPSVLDGSINTTCY